jgi:hypothetical protein
MFFFFEKRTRLLVAIVIFYNAGANPTIVSYNGNAVKIHNATSSLLLFENKNTFLFFEKNALACYNAGLW